MSQAGNPYFNDPSLLPDPPEVPKGCCGEAAALRETSLCTLTKQPLSSTFCFPCLSQPLYPSHLCLLHCHPPSVSHASPTLPVLIPLSSTFHFPKPLSPPLYLLPVPIPLSSTYCFLSLSQPPYLPIPVSIPQSSTLTLATFTNLPIPINCPYSSHHTTNCSLHFLTPPSTYLLVLSVPSNTCNPLSPLHYTPSLQLPTMSLPLPSLPLSL